jgi:hypothetical protein
MTKKLKLHRPTGKNRYCGPAALSAMTGFTTDQCAAVIRMVSGKTMVKGASTGEMINAIRAMGGHTTWSPYRTSKYLAESIGKTRITVEQYMRERGDGDGRNVPCLIVTNDHFLMSLRDMIVDTRHKDPVHYLSCSSARKYVTSVYPVTPPKDGWALPKALAITARTMRGPSMRKAALKIAAELGLTVKQVGYQSYDIETLDGSDDILEELSYGYRLSGNSWGDMLDALNDLRDDALRYREKERQRAA